MSRLGFACGSILLSMLAAAPARADAAPAPHAGQPVLLNEHKAMLELVKAEAATNVAIADGVWSAAATWKDGKRPAAGAIVLIPKDRSVVYDMNDAPDLQAIRVEGSLAFEPSRDTKLAVETLLVIPGASLSIGTEQQPIRRGHSANIVFTDPGPIDPAKDPGRMGRGLISHGQTTLRGDEVTAFVQLANPAHRGDTKLTLAAEPKNWKPGDRLVLPSTMLGNRQDEELTLVAISGKEVTVQPLRQDHDTPAADLTIPLANLSRTITLTSRNPAADRSGHVMFMHSGKVNLAYASFEHLGRTDKSKPINDPKMDDSGALVKGSGENPRGRYSVHFHRAGTTPDADTPQVVGCVVADSVGWGFVNHSSRVDFRDCVSFRVFGSGFVTEAGDETGSFIGNLAIRSAGSGNDEVARTDIQDFAHEGDGFWFQGPGIKVQKNIACGQATHGFIFFTQGLIQDGLGMTRFAASNFADPAWKGHINPLWHKDPRKISDPESAPVILVPITGFRDNVAFACDSGITVRFHTGSPNAGQSVIEKCTVWRSRYGMKVRYTAYLTLRDLRLVGNDKTCIAGVTGTLEGDQDIRYENLDVRGFPVGIHVPEVGYHTIVGGTFANARSILIPTPYARGRHVLLSGDIKFLDQASAKSDKSIDIDLSANFTPVIQANGYRDPNTLFAFDPVLIDTPSMKGQLYYVEQAADYVPFSKKPDATPEKMKRLGNAASVLPPQLIGLTNRELMERYGLALAGTIAPRECVNPGRMNALFGPPATYGKEYLPAELRTSNAKDYRLVILSRNDTAKKMQKGQPAGEAAELAAGWNLLTKQIEGKPVSVLVYAGDAVKEKIGKPGAKGKY